MNEVLQQTLVLVVFAGLIYVGIVELWTAWRNRRLMKQQPTGDVAVGDQLLNLQTGTNNVAIGYAAGAFPSPAERGVEVYYIDGPNGIKVQQFRSKRQEGADRG